MDLKMYIEPVKVIHWDLIEDNFAQEEWNVEYQTKYAPIRASEPSGVKIGLSIRIRTRFHNSATQKTYLSYIAEVNYKITNINDMDFTHFLLIASDGLNEYKAEFARRIIEQKLNLHLPIPLSEKEELRRTYETFLLL